MTVQYIYSAP